MGAERGPALSRYGAGATRCKLLGRPVGRSPTERTVCLHVCSSPIVQVSRPSTRRGGEQRPPLRDHVGARCTITANTISGEHHIWRFGFCKCFALFAKSMSPDMVFARCLQIWCSLFESQVASVAHVCTCAPSVWKAIGGGDSRDMEEPSVCNCLGADVCI